MWCSLVFGPLKWITWLLESDRSNRLSTQRVSDLFAAVGYFVLNFLHCVGAPGQEKLVPFISCV
ncbi:hypothetical protein EmuJ_000220600 [Echinococcus multilocularis]|uniref:Uncharacterized protein n=1 Tax=Echinococcus multilocularis TaxID=6211 RepID=A0A087W1L8_ECHMU|nr:hypothetical protein EmuJ_000220600 [Echinococcus multilocularis]